MNLKHFHYFQSIKKKKKNTQKHKHSINNNSLGNYGQTIRPKGIPL